jgi:hypothetical protein
MLRRGIFKHFFSETSRLAGFPEARKMPVVERFISISFGVCIMGILLADFGGFIGIKRSNSPEGIFGPWWLIRPIGIFGIMMIMDSTKWRIPSL